MSDTVEETKPLDEEERVHLHDSIRDLEVRLQRAEQEALGQYLAHLRDIEIASNILSEEADEHELCGVYDNVIASINKRITVPFNQREVEVSIRLTGEVTFQFDRRLSLEVPMGSTTDSPIVQARALDVLRSLGLRALAMNVVGDPAITVETHSW